MALRRQQAQEENEAREMNLQLSYNSRPCSSETINVDPALPSGKCIKNIKYYTY